MLLKWILLSCISVKHTPQKTCFLKMVFTDIYTNLVTNMNQIVEETGNRVLHYLKGKPHIGFVLEGLIFIPEDTQVPPKWISG